MDGVWHLTGLTLESCQLQLVLHHTLLMLKLLLLHLLLDHKCPLFSGIPLTFALLLSLQLHLLPLCSDTCSLEIVRALGKLQQICSRSFLPFLVHSWSFG